MYLKPILQELIENANATARNTTTFYDWKLLVEIGKNKITYPPEIYSTPQRPDIVIWSVQTKRVLNGELTCPAEEGIAAAQARKSARYSDLNCAAKVRGWTAEVATIKAGARGFIAKTLPHLLKRLGRCPKKISADCKTISIAAQCTYTIYPCT